MSRKSPRSEMSAYSPSVYGWEDQPPPREDVHSHQYPVQTYMHEGPSPDAGDETFAPPVYDAPPPAPAFSGRQNERHRVSETHRRSQSARDGESVPLLQPAPTGREGSEDLTPLAGILREPRRSRTMSRDGFFRGLPPVSGGANTSPPKAQVSTDLSLTVPGREDAAAAFLSMQNKPIRSSHIGATSKHRKSASANEGQTALLLQHVGGKEEGIPGYGATTSSSPQQSREKPQRTMSVGDIHQPAMSKRGFRRSQTEALPPVSPHVARRGSRSSLRSKSPEVSSKSRSSSHYRPSPPPDSSRRRRAGSEDENIASVTFEGGDSPLPPRPRMRTESDGSYGRTYMAPLSQPSSGLRKPTHRRVDSASSAASYASAAFSMASDMSVASITTDISKSKLFRGVTETGEVQLHLPIDNIRLTMDPDLEAGTIYKQKDWDEEERFHNYHQLADPSAQDLRGFDLDADCACQCTCDNCNHCRSKQEMLSDVRYVINVDDDLYKRVLSEISDSRAYPCGLYYCGHHEDVDTPSIFIAVGIVLSVFLSMFAITLLWGPYE